MPFFWMARVAPGLLRSSLVQKSASDVVTKPGWLGGLLSTADPTTFPSPPAPKAMRGVSLRQNEHHSTSQRVLKSEVFMDMETLPRGIVRWHETPPPGAQNGRRRFAQGSRGRFAETLEHVRFTRESEG